MKKIKNILFVDDDEITCFINQSIVEEIAVAENVVLLGDEQQALEFLASACARKSAGEDTCPELVFLDVNLSFANAFDFLEKLQHHSAIDLSKLFVVLLTSSMVKTCIRQTVRCTGHFAQAFNA